MTWLQPDIKASQESISTSQSLEYLGLATFRKADLCAITFYEPVFAWDGVAANAPGNVIIEFTAAPQKPRGDHRGLSPVVPPSTLRII